MIDIDAREEEEHCIFAARELFTGVLGTFLSLDSLRVCEGEVVEAIREERAAAKRDAQSEADRNERWLRHRQRVADEVASELRSLLDAIKLAANDMSLDEFDRWQKVRALCDEGLAGDMFARVDARVRTTKAPTP